MQFRFSVRAELDIKEIGDYIAQDDPARAINFIQSLRHLCEGLAIFPEAMPARHEY